MLVADYDARLQEMADELRRLEPLSTAEIEHSSACLAAVHRLSIELGAEFRKQDINRADRAAHMSLLVKSNRLLITAQRAWIDAKKAQWNGHDGGT